MEMERIYRVVCAVCWCTEKEVRSKSRKRLHVIARKLIVYLLPDLTESDVGELINRDHATVNYYKRTKADNLAGDKLLKTIYIKIAKMIK
jgi:chromosomal replication initiation ATPase DnaA